MWRTDGIVRVAGLVATLVLAAVSACTLSPLPEASSCGPQRREADGSCCPLFTRYADGECTPRSLVELDPLGAGHPGALALAVDGTGRGLVGWTQETDVLVAEETTDGRFVLRDGLAPKNQGTALGLDVAAGPTGEALVAWGTNGVPAPDGSRVFYASRTATGAWTAAASPISFGDRAYEPRVAIGPDGDAVLLWNQWYDDSHYGVAFATARHVGAPLEAPAAANDVLSPPVFFSNGPRVAVGADGEVVVTWYQAESELMTYVSQRASRDEAMTRPAAGDHLSVSGGPVDSHPVSNPKPALGPDGQAAVVWTQEDARGSVRTYLATRDAGGNWYSPRSLDDALSGGGYSRCAEVVFGAKGDLFVVFQQDNVAMLSARAADGTWLTPPGSPQRLSGEGVLGLDPHVAAGRDGSVVVVFHELDGTESRLRVLELESGAPEIAKPPLVAMTGTGFGTPLVAVGGEDDRVLIGVIEHTGDSSRVRLLSQ